MSKADFETLAHFRYQLRRFLRFSEEATRRKGVAPQLPADAADQGVSRAAMGDGRRNGFCKAIETGQTRHGDRVLTTRSVNKMYVDLSFGLLIDEAATVVGALAIGRECTARYLSDKALRARDTGNPPD